MSRIDILKNLSSEYEKSSFYDLFCDHGKLGKSILSSNADALVTFNDCREHLIEKIRLDLSSENRADFVTANAQELVFKRDSVVIGAGVGGLLLIECIKSWMKTHDHSLLSSLTFLLSPHYYDIELRRFLHETDFRLVKEYLCLDQKYYYDMLVIRWDTEGDKVPLVPRDEGLQYYRGFIEHRHKTLSKIRNKSSEELNLVAQYEQILGYE